MLRRFTLSLVVLLCLGIGLPTIPVVSSVLDPIIGTQQAQAQQKKKRKTLLDIIFERRKK